MTSESFTLVLKTTTNMDELSAIKNLLDQYITPLRSRDTGGEDGKFGFIFLQYKYCFNKYNVSTSF